MLYTQVGVDGGQREANEPKKEKSIKKKERKTAEHQSALNNKTKSVSA